METARTHNEGRNGVAAVYMLLSVIGYSLIPPLIAWGDGAASPFLFNASMTFGLVIGYSAFLLAGHWVLVRNREVLSLIWRHTFSWAILFTAISYFDFALFAWSARLVDISVTAVLFEIWPILVIILTAWLLGGRFNKVSQQQYALVCLCIIGFAFAVSSQHSGPWTWNLNFSSSIKTAAGVILAVMSAGVTSLTSFSFKWGVDLSTLMHGKNGIRNTIASLDLFCVVTAQLIANIITTPLNILAGFASQESFGGSLNPQMLLIGIFGGITASAGGSIAWRKSNLTTRNLGVNAIGYATPILSLGWLWLFSQVNVDNPDYLVIGAAAIICANLLINFEAERLLGFKALVLALWACGTLVYLRSIDKWQWVGGGPGYFEVLALSATIFTLILSFRVARLANRTRDEDNRTFNLFYELQAMSGRGLINPAVCEHILAIDSSQGPELQSAYAETRRCIAVALRRAGQADRDKLVAARAQLDALAHSRQQGINFGEICALFIFASITVGMALFLRPASSGLTAFLIEMFTVLFSAVIVFLAVNVFDLQRARGARILRRSDSGGYTLVFQDSSRRKVEQGITIAVGIAIVVAYAGLLGCKWLGWFGCPCAAPLPS